MDELLAVLKLFLNETSVVFITVRIVNLDGYFQQLVLQSLLGQHEVDDVHFGVHFRRVARVVQLRSEEHPEVFVTFQTVLPQLDHHAPSLFVKLLRQERV